MSESDKTSSLKDLCGLGSPQECPEGSSAGTIILAIVGVLLFLQMLLYCWYSLNGPLKLNIKSIAQWCKKWSMKSRQQTPSSLPPVSKHHVTVWLPPQHDSPRKGEKIDTKDRQACQLPVNATKALSTFHSYVSKCGVLCINARPQQDQCMSRGDSSTDRQGKPMAKIVNLTCKMETGSKMTDKSPIAGQATRVKPKTLSTGPILDKKSFHSDAGSDQKRSVGGTKADKAESHSQEKDGEVENQLVRPCILPLPDPPAASMHKSEEKKLEVLVSSTTKGEVGLLSQKQAKNINQESSQPSIQTDKPALCSPSLESPDDGTLVKVSINQVVKPRSRSNTPDSPWILVSAERNQSLLSSQEEVEFSKPLLNVKGTLDWLSSGIVNVLPVTSLAVWWNSTAPSMQEQSCNNSPPGQHIAMEDDLHTSFYPQPPHHSDKEFHETV